MRLSICVIFGMMAVTVGFGHSVFYLDTINDRDLVDSQTISSSGTSSTLPASKPIVLDEIVSTNSESTQTTTSIVVSGSSGIIIEDTTEEVEHTNPINQLPELQRDAEFLMSLRWLYDQ